LFPHVIGSGALLVKDSRVLSVKPGRRIRNPVEAKGRYEPLTVGQWLDKQPIKVLEMRVDATGAAKEVGAVTTGILGSHAPA
jgi:hypothetical protein